MEYKVADSYKNYELIGEPYTNDKGKLVSKARCKCDRCTNGIYVSRVENNHIVPHPAYDGICLKCKGSGYINKEIRLYTEKEYEQMNKNNERAKERKEEKALAGAEEKRNKWLKDNGFNEEGYTYILIGMDTYSIKDKLKEEGWKYNSFLRWHINAIPADYKDNVYKLYWRDAYSTSVWGDMYPMEDLQKRIDTIIESNLPHSSSEWIGTIGKKVENILVKVISKRNYQGRFGYSQIITFETLNGEKIVWFTNTIVTAGIGDTCLISGIVKDHTEYKGVKQTLLKRCSIVTDGGGE